MDLAAKATITIVQPWRALVPKEYHQFGKSLANMQLIDSQERDLGIMP
jgi:hypothetical protein